MADTTPPKTGKAGVLNTVSGVTSVVMTDDKELSLINKPIPKGILVFNESTRELKPSDGKTRLGDLKDHEHPFTHASLNHSHFFGTNEPWLMTNPRLWYIEDVANHPELVVLDGSEIPAQRAEYLSQVYPGTKLLTTPVGSMTTEGFVNDDLILSADRFVSPYNPAALFGDTLSITNFSIMSDQWLTGSKSLTTESVVTISFLKGFAYQPTQYILMPAAGTAEIIFEKRPTPKSWVLEGSSDDESTWTVIDERSDVPATFWSPCVGAIFNVNDTTEDYKKLRLRITEWNAGSEANGPLETGLRRFWIFGRKSGTFALPNVESPHPDFVYVVPNKNLNVGLIHENVGDIGFTSVQKSLIPSYRLVADGRMLDAADQDNELLYAAIGHLHDPEAVLQNVTALDGTINQFGSWQPGITDETQPTYIEADISDAMIGGYKLDATSTRVPLSWVVEGFNAETSDWDTLQELTMTEDKFKAVNGNFYLDTTVEDKNYSKIRINFLEWNIGEAPIGLDSLSVFVHPIGKFYIPSISSHDGDTPYIVRNVTAIDVSPEIIQRLQKNISELAKAHASLVNRVDGLDPNLS